MWRSISRISINCKIIFTLLLITQLGFSQKIDESLKTKNWGIGKSMKIFDTKITRLKGDNNENGITNVGFEIDEKHAGFTLHLYITRTNGTFVNLRNFILVVNDNNGVEVCRDTLGFKPGKEIPKKEIYWNYGYVTCSKEVKNATIYLYDKIGIDGNKEFIFKIKDD